MPEAIEVTQMRKFSLPACLLLLATTLSGSGCAFQTYQDYPWGDYAWESSHNHRVTPDGAWGDYEQYFGKEQPRPSGG